MESLLLVGLGVGALFARSGLALYVAGQSRSKNAAAAMMRMCCDFCFVTLAFWCVGAALLDQVNNPVLGIRVQRLFGGGADALFFFQVAALLTATAVVNGATAERSKFWIPCAASIVLAGLIIPIAANWAWYGWLNRLGFTDVAGAAALHVSAAVCALVGAAAVGARNGKFNRDGSSNLMPGHSVPMASAGVFITVAGWIAYVIGSSIRTQVSVDASAANTLLAAAAGGAAALGAAQFRYGKPDVSFLFSGLLGGLVAISASAGWVGPRSAVVIGAIAGIIVPFAANMLDLQFRIDDPSGLIAVQLVGGGWGTLAASIAVSNPEIGFFHHLFVQITGLVAIALFSGIVSIALFTILKSTVGFRTREADEFEGLDLVEHDIGAYPDFQQNMIKSYHLRET